MENLEIISSQKTVQARKEINGNTANFSWNFTEGQIPSAINFNVQRGVAGDQNHTGNMVISGAFYSKSEKFDVQNNNFQVGDLDIYSQVLATCQDILEEFQTETE